MRWGVSPGGSWLGRDSLCIDRPLRKDAGGEVYRKLHQTAPIEEEEAHLIQRAAALGCEKSTRSLLGACTR